MYKISDQQVFDLIDLIYSAGLNPDCWENVVSHLGEVFPYAATAFQVFDFSHERPLTCLTANWESGAFEAYAESFSAISPWTPVHQRAQVGIPYVADEICPRSSYLETEFFADFIKPHKVGCSATAVKLFEDTDRFATIGFNYAERLGDRLNEPFRRLLSNLAPHLRRAIEMNRKLAELDYATRTAESLLDNIASPAFLLTSDCKVVHMNSRAQRAIRRKRGLMLTSVGCLVLEKGAETNKLQQLVSEAADFNVINGSSTSGFLIFTVPGELSPNSMLVYPMVPPSNRLSLGRMQDPVRQVLTTVHYRQDSHLLPEDRVRAAFGFTPAESQVVLALAAGTTVSEFAEQTSRSVHTVRLHLKRVLSKADCHSQLELMKVVVRTIGEPI